MVNIEFKQLPIKLQRKVVDIAINLDLDVEVVYEFIKNNKPEDIMKLKGLSYEDLQNHIHS